MNAVMPQITARERELGAIINAYNEVTERLKVSHDKLLHETRRMRGVIAEKNRELARRQRLAALGEMAAGVAHEIRNPLAGIQLYSELLQRDLAEHPGASELAEKISRGVKAMDGIVSDVLAFAKGAEPQCGSVPLAALFRDCREGAEPVRLALRATLTVNDGLDDFELWVDRGQIRQALSNLLHNALDAAGEGGQVWLNANLDSARGDCEIHIADNGPGISEEDRERIFNPFFTTKHTGTGLGLAITHRIIEAHGGSIRVLTRSGGGAEMVLRLPCAQDKGTH